MLSALLTSKDTAAKLIKKKDAAWKDKHPGGKVIERDLTKTEMTFVDLDWIIGA
jgi:FMN-dependent NADH-azoreductase